LPHRVYVEEGSLVVELRIHDVKEVCKCPPAMLIISSMDTQFNSLTSLGTPNC
jgi:hypothetical protein